MKKLLTNNIGLKILSFLGAIILWIIVVNVDDPVITRVYSGIPVEIINESVIADEGKTYEVVDGTDVISVSVTAERSIIESLTKDNIRATADMKNMTFMNTVPIEIRSTRYAEKINTMSSRNSNISVVLEDKKDKQLKLSIATEGQVAKGYIAGEITPVVDVVKVSGPASKVARVNKVEICVEFADMNETFTTSCPVKVLDVNDREILDDAIIVSQTEIRTSVEILETKEIPVTAYFTGTAAMGYGATGTVICTPSSITIAGKGSLFDDLSSVKIPDDALSIDGATGNVKTVADVEEYLPKGVVLADTGFSGEIEIEAVIEEHENLVVNVPVKSIQVTNLPENYEAHVVYGEDTIPFEIAGLQEDLAKLSISSITAQVDAANLSPRLKEDEELDESAPIYVGINDGQVMLGLPENLTQISSMSIEVIINHNEKTEEENRE